MKIGNPGAARGRGAPKRPAAPGHAPVPRTATSDPTPRDPAARARAPPDPGPEFESPPQSKFGLWKSTFEVAYETAEAEARALAAFLETDARIVAHNAKNSTYKLGHNEFSGMFWDEFVAQYVGDATGATTEATTTRTAARRARSSARNVAETT